MSEKIIIGKNGFIAKKLQNTNEKYLVTSSGNYDKDEIYLDLNNTKDFDYSIIDRETIIIFLAAISSPDICNREYEKAYNINVVGTKYFIKETIKRGGKVLFFSSDVVYGNTTKEVYEDDRTNPFGKYAKMKDEIEKEFEGEKNFKVFRLSYVLSSEDKYLSYLKSCADNNGIAEVFDPFYRKVVYIEDVLNAIENILVKWEKFDNQKFNICGEENISRKNMADFYNVAIGNKLKYETLVPNDEFWKARPKDINICSRYLEQLLGRKPTNISDAIKQIIQGDK